MAGDKKRKIGVVDDIQKAVCFFNGLLKDSQYECVPIPVNGVQIRSESLPDVELLLVNAHIGEGNRSRFRGIDLVWSMRGCAKMDETAIGKQDKRLLTLPVILYSVLDYKYLVVHSIHEFGQSIFDIPYVSPLCGYVCLAQNRQQIQNILKQKILELTVRKGRKVEIGVDVYQSRLKLLIDHFVNKFRHDIRNPLQDNDPAKVAAAYQRIAEIDTQIRQRVGKIDLTDSQLSDVIGEIKRWLEPQQIYLGNRTVTPWVKSLIVERQESVVHTPRLFSLYAANISDFLNPNTLQKTGVLIVEDEPETAEGYKDCLARQMGFDAKEIQQLTDDYLPNDVVEEIKNRYERLSADLGKMLDLQAFCAELQNPTDKTPAKKLKDLLGEETTQKIREALRQKEFTDQLKEEVVANLTQILKGSDLWEKDYYDKENLKIEAQNLLEERETKPSISEKERQRFNLRFLLASFPHVISMPNYAPVEIAIIDLMLRNGDEAGIEILRKIKFELPRIRIVVISGRNDRQFEALAHGADYYITKPIRDWEQDFCSIIGEALYWKRVLLLETEQTHHDNLRMVEPFRRSCDGIKSKEQKYTEILRNISDYFASHWIKFEPYVIESTVPDAIAEKIEDGRYDLILLDGFAEADDWDKGKRLFKEIRRRHREVPIIILAPTGIGAEKNKLIFHELKHHFRIDFDDFRVKPLGFEQLRQIKEIFEQQGLVKYDVRYTLLLPKKHRREGQVELTEQQKQENEALKKKYLESAIDKFGGATVWEGEGYWWDAKLVSDDQYIVHILTRYAPDNRRGLIKIIEDYGRETRQQAIFLQEERVNTYEITPSIA